MTSELRFEVDERVPERLRNQIYIEEMSVIHRAAQKGSLPIFKQLLSYGLSLDSESYMVHNSEKIFLGTPLHAAAAYNRKEIVEYILKRQGNKFVNQKCSSAPAHINTSLNLVSFDPTSCTPVALAFILNDKSVTFQDRYDTLNLLVKNGATLDYEGQYGDTLLHVFALMLREHQDASVPEIFK